MSKDSSEIIAKLDRLTGLVTAEFKAIRSDIAAQGERIARMEGRLDEQSRILAAMIPTTLAAVPAAKQTPIPPAE